MNPAKLQGLPCRKSLKELPSVVNILDYLQQKIHFCTDEKLAVFLQNVYNLIDSEHFPVSTENLKHGYMTVTLKRLEIFSKKV